MMKTFTKTLTKTLTSALLIAAATILAGCGSSSGLSGKYIDGTGTVELEFTDGSHASMTGGGAGETIPLTYKVDGNKITLTGTDGSHDLTILSNGTLTDGQQALFTKETK